MERRSGADGRGKAKPVLRLEGGWRAPGIAAVLLFVLPGLAWAIPSPDVVVNLFASTAQVLGLATVVLGRWTFRRARAGAAARGGSHRLAFRVTLGLFLASLAGFGLFYTRVEDARIQRLRVNLVRDSKENGRLIADANLKTLSFSDQFAREDAFSTEQLAQEIVDRRDLQIWDIREDEEVEMGAIEGSRHVRYPDLMLEPERYLDRSRPVYLLCFNGNRSSEVSDRLQPLGFEARFMIGGYEKWMAEDRPLALGDRRTGRDLRELPKYPNDDVLLDTPDAKRLVETRGAIFLDVRYPGEFETLGHLPEAINVPFRMLPSPELEARLRAIPRRPVIAACYDKRSSFFAQIVGLRLNRMGYEFLGRYTVPEGYSVPPKDKPHVAAWTEAREGKSLLTAASEPLSGALGGLHTASGSLAIAILALVALLRIALLPLSWKAERDRRVQAGLDGRLAELKGRLAGDPRALSRATLRLLREHRIRPLLNLAGTSFQLVLFVVFFTVVQRAAAGSEEAFAWIPALGERDPLYLLPALIAALLALQVALSARKRTPLRAAGWLAAAGLLFALTFSLSAAVNLYLALNLALIVAHTLAAGRWVRSGEPRVAPRTLERWSRMAAIPLRGAHLVDGTGAKAARLARLIEAGLPVPDGYVIPAKALESRRPRATWRAQARREIEREQTRLGADRVAVRSSGLNEDGAQQSYAGVFESVLDVDRGRLFDAIAEVHRSLGSARAQAYGGNGRELGAILVQRMVPARWAGVLFTEHPAESGSMLVELVEGLGEDLVAGRAAPRSFRIGRASGEVKDAERPPLDLAPLVELGRRVERLFGTPQDIEWAFDGRRFFLLQARDITRLSSSGEELVAIRERERRRLLDLVGQAGAREVVLAQGELSELLPSPTPFSLAWMDALWAHGGSTDLACRELGIRYDVEPDSPPLAVSVLGSLYVNRAEERRRTSRGCSAMAAFRLARSAGELERAFREDVLPSWTREVRLREALDLSRLDLAEVVELFETERRQFVQTTYVEAEKVNLAADAYLKTAVRALERRGLDAGAHLGEMPSTVVHDAMERLAAHKRGEEPLASFLELFGHRAPQDYELSQPRYREDPELVREMAARSAPVARRRPTLLLAPRGRMARVALERARRFQALKEEAKHHALRQLAFVRTLLLEIGRRTRLGDDVFWLLPDEVARLEAVNLRALEARARTRREESEAYGDVRVPAEITAGWLESLDCSASAGELVAVAPGEMSGLRVAGKSEVSGRVRVLRGLGEIDSFRRGEVLVARFTDPTWTPAFPRAAGIVTEVGGWLSHAAIQARECGIVAIVGVRGAMEGLRTGDLVHLRADGGVERFEDRRREARMDVSLLVRLHSGGRQLEGRLSDLSECGALLCVSGETLELGTDVDLQAVNRGQPVSARVVRNGTPGAYGLVFEKPEEAHQALAVPGPRKAIEGGRLQSRPAAPAES
jgi:phosphoenolpyruvate synthase/pyruvate phosphate dikinase/rhodanese-related sulfurtransferase